MFEHFLSNLLFLFFFGHLLHPRLILIHPDNLPPKLLIGPESSNWVEDGEGEVHTVLEEHVGEDVYEEGVEKLCYNHVECVGECMDKGEQKWKGSVWLRQDRYLRWGSPQQDLYLFQSH